MQTHCDQCNKSFVIKPKTKKHGQGIKETYFKCPWCKHIYTSYVTDAECRRLQARLRKLQEERRLVVVSYSEGSMGEYEYNAVYRTLENKEKQIGIELQGKMNRLKEKVIK